MGPGEYTDVGALTLQPDGKITLVGDVGDSHGLLDLGAWRLLGDGPAGRPADPDALGWLPPNPPDHDAEPPPSDSQMVGAPPTSGEHAGPPPAAADADGATGPPAQHEGAASSPNALASRRASLRVALSTVRRTLASPRGRRTLAHGGLTVSIRLPAGNRLSVTLLEVRSPNTMLAHGDSTATATGPTHLRLRTTRAGRRALHTPRPLRVILQPRLESTTTAALAARTTITLPIHAGSP
jgi:hypothetical protein